MSDDEQPNKCALCGEPMPPGEQMFKYHGFSGPCPNPASETVVAHNAECNIGDATYWATVADGASHHPRCARNLVTNPRYVDGMEWVCLRCQLEDTKQELSRLNDFMERYSAGVKAWAVMDPADSKRVLFVEVSRKCVLSWKKDNHTVIPGMFFYSEKARK